MARLLQNDYQHFNEWVSDHLAERGFTGTLQKFRGELKNDKISNIDATVDYINQCILNLHMQELVQLWQELDKRIFSRLHSEHGKAAASLETRMFKFLMVTAVMRNQPKKAQEALEHMMNSPRMRQDPDLRNWFQIPYIKHPESDSLCAKYCTKFWQETFTISLYNFISSAFQTATTSLLAHKMKTFARQDTPSEHKSNERKLQGGFTFGRSGPSFATLSKSGSRSEHLRSKFNRAIATMQSRSLPQAIFTEPVSETPEPNSGMTSPVNTTTRPRQHSSASESSVPIPAPKPTRVGSSHSLSEPTVTSPSRPISSAEKEHEVKWISNNLPFRESAEYLFHMVCNEDLGSHDAAVTDCIFSPCATKVASVDTKGCMKVWKGIPPATKLLSTYRSSSTITCLRWSSKSDDLIVIGDSAGNISLVDGGNGTVVMEVNVGSEVTVLATHPSRDGGCIACGTSGSAESQYGIFVIDLATFTIRNELRYASHLTACSFHPEKSVLLCGFNTGEICEYNIKFQKFGTKFMVHTATVQQVDYLKDESFCLSVGDDTKLVISYLSFGCRKLAEMVLNLPENGVPYPFRHAFASNFDGSFILVRCRNGAKVYKIKGRMNSFLYIERPNSLATSLDWCTYQDKSTGIIGYNDGSIRWFRLLHLA
ncbi:WD repeat-containing protein 91-like isoform X2 [Paramacrobiotus metropolitanus]|nr:WD repeat-containing protein 91-like isoform X2 [Paramacrobiotus metropolitanus]XP_055339941.1 WD repeat-containing protein 91-like isoform X2 [Paramacrobiotus metropolitanus]